MVDILLINSPMILNRRNEEYIMSEGDEKSSPPLGVLYLASYLRDKGVSVKVTDMSAEGKVLEDILEMIEDERPKLVGFSAMASSIRSAVKLAHQIREKTSYELTLGIGGAHVNSDHDFIDRYNVFDFAIIGEGEKSLFDVYNKIVNGEKFPRKIYGEPVKNLDDIPFPARDLVEPSNYFLHEEHTKGKKPIGSIIGSRGCPFKCSFCSSPLISRKVRFRSAKNIVDEMEAMYDSCGGHYCFQDDVMTLSKKHTVALCKEIIDRGLKVRWMAMTRATAIKPDMVEWLAKAGCDGIFFGVESGNERIRNEIIKKKVTDQDIKEAVTLCRKHGIHTSLFLMVGFPTETLAEMEDTVKIGHKVGADLIGIHITIPHAGTEVYNYAIEHGIVEPDIIDKFIRDELGDPKANLIDVWPLFVPLGLELEDLVKVKKRAYRSFYLNPKFIFRRIIYWIRHPSRFKDDLPLFKIAPYTLFKGRTKGTAS
jgi:anaerobic magnesium-protoporphyrin IX monomethyl ester cyclase